MRPTLSLITPSFNQAQFLEQTIDSVLTQGYPHLEYIIIDGQSTDGSVEIIRKHEKHLAYWISEPDRGQSHAINKGLQRVQGDVVNWLNSDDYLEPGSLNAIAGQFSNPSVNVVAGRSHIVQDGKVVRVTAGTDVYTGNVAKTLGCARIDQPETFFRKKVFDRLGMLDEGLHFVMDKEFWMRYLLAFGLEGVVKIPTVLANFRWHDDSKTLRQKKQFVQESAGLMYQLAVANHLLDESEKIKGLPSFYSDPVDIPLREGFKTRPELARQALHNFLLISADEYYYQHDPSTCLDLLSFIDRGVLAPVDQHLFDKLRRRSRFIPAWVTKLLRP